MVLTKPSESQDNPLNHPLPCRCDATFSTPFRSRRRAVLIVVREMMLGACAFVIACVPMRSDETESNTSGMGNDRNEVVAVVGGRSITVGELSDALARQTPYVRLRFASHARKRDFFMNYVRSETLYQEAKRQRLGADPGVLREVKLALVDVLRQRLYGELAQIGDIRSQDVRTYFEAHRAEFVTLARRRVTWLLAKDKKEAARLAALVNEQDSGLAYFSKLAAEHSIDRVSKKKDGDLGFFTAEDSFVPKEIRDSAFQHSNIGELHGPLKVDTGYALWMLTGVRPAVRQSLDEVKDRIRTLLFRQMRDAALKTHVSRLEKKATIQIVQTRLDSVPSEFPHAVERSTEDTAAGTNTTKGNGS